MRTLVMTALAAPLLAVSAASVATASPVLVKVDLARQQMTVEVDGKSRHTWLVSTAAADYTTPTGTYRPTRMHTIWYSKKYDDAPMPHSIFYSGGFAIHGTQSVRILGRPASHGCVRLAPTNAATLFELVKKEGMASTRIVIHGTPPAPPPVVAKPAPQVPSNVVFARQQPQPSLFAQLFGGPSPPRVVAQPMLAKPVVYQVTGPNSVRVVPVSRIPTYRLR